MFSSENMPDVKFSQCISIFHYFLKALLKLLLKTAMSEIVSDRADRRNWSGTLRKAVINGCWSKEENGITYVHS